MDGAAGEGPLAGAGALGALVFIQPIPRFRPAFPSPRDGGTGRATGPEVSNRHVPAGAPGQPCSPLARNPAINHSQPLIPGSRKGAVIRTGWFMRTTVQGPAGRRGHVPDQGCVRPDAVGNRGGGEHRGGRSALIREAAAGGAELIATPEMTTLLDRKPGRVLGEIDQRGG